LKPRMTVNICDELSKKVIITQWNDNTFYLIVLGHTIKKKLRAQIPFFSFLKSDHKAESPSLTEAYSSFLSTEQVLILQSVEKQPQD